MSRPAVANIHLGHIVDNFRLAQALCPQAGQALAVVKADAYGHGAVKVAEALAPHCPAFAVACIEEALELRNAGIQQPILLLEGLFTADELPLIAEQNFWVVVHSPFQIDEIQKAQLIAPIQVWLKVDTGMHRLGIHLSEVEQQVARLNAMSQVSGLVVMTHFANADIDEPAGISPAQQIARLTSVTQTLDVDYSLANSAALLAHPVSRKNWQRPGIMLYGASPLETETPESLQLKPAMTLETRVIATHWVEVGESVGYGSRFVAEQRTRIGTIAMGYADGYPRQAKEGTPIAVDGQLTQLSGRVSMDMMTVDLTHIPSADVGSRVELWGEQISANQIASQSDTISYHLFTGITRRVRRRYLPA
ncbi:MAG: alanine racemase [Oceanobacter sp.]